MENINQTLLRYIESKVFPQYSKNEPGHRLNHIEYVIDRSFKLSHNLDVNPNIVYVVAAYHDLGNHIDRKNHEKVSAELMSQDKGLRLFFNDEEIHIIKQAIEDHRASADHTPRNIYGKIVSSADRGTSIEMAIYRTYSYTLEHYPHFNYEQSIDRSYQHLQDKFGEKGYAKSYIKDDEYSQYLVDLRKLLSSRKDFRAKYDQVITDAS